MHTCDMVISNLYFFPSDSGRKLPNVTRGGTNSNHCALNEVIYTATTVL